MKHIKRLLLLLMVCALIICLVICGIALHRVHVLLQHAGLPFSCIRSIIATDSFTDWLCYTDGYDWAVLRVNPAAFVPPEDWMEGCVPLEEINPAPEGLGCYDFHPDFLHRAPLPESYSAWRYIPRDESAPFDTQEWFAFMYDESTGTLVLYRGHSFYGSR